MDHSSSLQTRPAVVGDGIWCSTRWSIAGLRRTLVQDYGTGFQPLERTSSSSLAAAAAPSSRTRWARIWKRVVREKKRMTKPARRKHEPYDPYTYAQNFDDGSASVELENLARGFSARFAVSSRAGVCE